MRKQGITYDPGFTSTAACGSILPLLMAEKERFFTEDIQLNSLRKFNFSRNSISFIEW